MSSSEYLVDQFGLLCELRIKNWKTSENLLSTDIHDVNNTFNVNVDNINKMANFLNEESVDVVKGRASSNVISVGRESSSLMVSLHRLANTIINTNTNNHHEHLEDALHSRLSKAEDEINQLEDYIKSTKQFIQNYEYTVKHIKPKPEGENCSNVSEFFFPMDLATSSPMKNTLANSFYLEK